MNGKNTYRARGETHLVLAASQERAWPYADLVGTHDVVIDQPRQTPAIAGKYLSLTSFRRDGSGVATPVWFVQEGRRLLVETERDSYKVRRIRHNPSVRVAVCTATGRLRGEQMPARAELLPDSETGRVQRLLAEKYRFDMIFIKPLRALQEMLRRDEHRSKPVIVAITPR